MSENTEASLRYINEAAIHDHALVCSTQFRAGRFTRVGGDFVDEVKADVEAFIRELRNKFQTSPHEPLETDQQFVTGALLERVREQLNRYIGRLVQQKVQRQPSVGKTLGATR